MADLNVLHLYMLLNYFPETGLFQWQERTPIMVDVLGLNPSAVAAWNTKHAGKIAGHIDNEYVIISILGEDYRAHLIAWFMYYGHWPENEIDHINGIRSENWIDNLRDVTRPINMKNKPKYKTNKSGVTGVYWHKAGKKWAAEIGVNKKIIRLGLYENIETAVAVRAAAEIHYGFHQNHGR